MKYKSLPFFVLLIHLYWVGVDAQTADQRWAIQALTGVSHYNGDRGNSIFDLDPYQQFVGMSITRHLNRSFDAELRLQYGRHGVWFDHGQNNFLSDQFRANLGLHYAFIGDHVFTPYLTAGLGLAHYTPVDDRATKSTDFILPLGLGLDINVSSRFSIVISSEYGFNYGDAYDQIISEVDKKNDHWLHTSVGLKFNFGKLSDIDQDGIPDKHDACPDEAGLASLMGCPDSDGDGTPDREDLCPHEPGPPNLGGCPDMDGDGVVDNEDRCPEVAGPSELEGCPDSDGDGVADIDDRCPDLKGIKTLDGCPEVKTIHQKTLDEALYGIFFDYDKAIIKAESYEVLNKIVAIMRENKYYTLRIEGHTDNAGSEAYNLKLSQDRADAVKSYLMQHNIPSERIAAIGFGQGRPISSNDTEEGRAKNRRVEFILSYN